MPDTLHVLCALNPTAGGGVALRRWPEIEAFLTAFGLTWDRVAEPGIPLGEQVIRHLETRRQPPCQAVVGIGGDGTHSQLINALMAYRQRPDAPPVPPYALIPMGTGNNIAKSFGLNSREDFFVSDLRQAVATIRYGADYDLDLGRLGTAYFVNALNAGLDARILREHNRRKESLARHPWLSQCLHGNLLYTWCLGRQFWRQSVLQATIQVDGRCWYNGPIINLVITNTRVYAGEFVLCPNAYANDGRLDVVVFTGYTDYLTKYLLALRLNPRQMHRLAERLSRVAAYAQGRQIQAQLSRAEAVQYDGEVLPASSRLEVSVVSRAFRIKVPAERA